MRLPIYAGLSTGAVAMTLYSLFNGGAWFWACLGVVLTVTAVAAAVTRFGLPRWSAPLLELAGLLIFLSAAFAGDKAWWRIVPTKDSMIRLSDLIFQGFDDIQRFAAPVPDNVGISLLTSGGVGLIAILVDLFAVRMRRAALGGLPLLALFTVPAAVLNDPIAWPAFVIGSLGFVGLLLADGRERLTHWGRAVLVRRSRTTTAVADTGRLSLSGKRVGLTAIALAIVLPALIPALTPAPLFGFGVGNGTGKGGNSIGIPDAIAKLSGQLTQQSNATVLTYTVSDDTPRYLRIYSLDVFDGQKFTVSPLRGKPEDRTSDGPLPLTPGLGPAIPVKRVTTNITISDKIEKLQFLPLPYAPVQVDVDGDWRADEQSLMVFSTKDEAAGLHYTALVGEPQPTRAQLEAVPQLPEAARYLSLPAGLPQEVYQKALEVTRDANNPYEQAILLQKWFTKDGGFTYNLATRGSGSDALAQFILNDRAGYCEQFASAMAVMARMLGIPSRVAIGYTGGTKIDKLWTVRTHDAHAWPELYFQGVGWLRFEPTPAGSLGQGTARVPAYSLPSAPTTNPSAGPSPGASTGSDNLGPDSASRRNLRELDRETGPAGTPVDQGLPLIAKIGIGLAILLLLSLIPAVVRLIISYGRRRALTRAAAIDIPDEPDDEPVIRDEWSRAESMDSAAPPQARPERLTPAAVEAGWAELCDMLIDYGVPKTGSETPRALARRLVERYEFDAATTRSVGTIATAEEQLRYAPIPPRETPLPSDVRQIKRALAGTVSRWRRIGAVVTPMSTLLRIRGLGERVLDGFDLLEGIRLRPRRDDDGKAATPSPGMESETLTGSRR
ncbi:transglutaminase domain-containing protein [Streptosporangiaceae bacterium NEAU-GS5]|nr:transglutaminase domain-containing protein [Streptosporangiaceae bacterium NEAU-GS5]